MRRMIEIEKIDDELRLLNEMLLYAYETQRKLKARRKKLMGKLE